MASPRVTAYAPLYDEFDYVIDDYDGELPADLHGTLYRNGPGKLDAGASSSATSSTATACCRCSPSRTAGCTTATATSTPSTTGNP